MDKRSNFQTKLPILSIEFSETEKCKGNKARLSSWKIQTPSLQFVPTLQMKCPTMNNYG